MMRGLPTDELVHLAASAPLAELVRAAGEVRDSAFGSVVTYARNVFIPLTHLCRDVCHYCTFAKPPRGVAEPYMSRDAVLAVAEAGARAGCKEALFTLGDRPEARYAAARAGLQALGHETTVGYVAETAGLVLERTGLLPHVNAGVLSLDDYRRLREVSGSMGLMLESVSERLCAPGGPHYGSPDKQPAVRLQSIADAGRAKVPFTSGLLIGIGETRRERLDALLALRELHETYGHLQELILQNFRPKPGTKMSGVAEPSEDELLWTIAVARLCFGGSLSLQAPPNLNPGRTAALLQAGADDFGGVSPVTVDHVNPEAPWPTVDALAAECAEAGYVLAERLTAYPPFVRDADRWMAEAPRRRALALCDATGLAEEDGWRPGVAATPPLGAHGPPPSAPFLRRASPVREALSRVITAVAGRSDPASGDVAALFEARGAEAHDVVVAADELRQAACGETVTYVVNRNINYTNICSYRCGFCAFSKSSAKDLKRDTPYVLSAEIVAQRVREARAAGATEVCLQGGIHPSYTGETYLAICRAVKAAVPDMHIHAFSPLEVSHGAQTLKLPVIKFLAMLKAEGLSSLPGTAAEVLHDDVRRVICPDKVSADEWLSVIGDAHRVGLKTTSTIMFGHVDAPHHWAQHLLSLRRLQGETGGITEFVPLPFVHMEAPIYRRGRARRGPTWRETVLMHAIGRIVLHGRIGNVQASWVKLGLDGAAALLNAGVNDLGGVLMNESISRAAGAAHGQSVTSADFAAAVAPLGRPLTQRTTSYGAVRPMIGLHEDVRRAAVG